MEKISKKIQILDASEELFFKLGFEGASTRAIAKVARVNMAMINYYFGSKEGLFAAVIVRLMQDFGVQMVDIDRQNLTVKEKFYKVVHMYIERMLQRPEMFMIVYRELNLVRNQEMVDLISDRIYQNYNAMAQLLKKGIDDGEFREVNVRMVIATVFGVLSHIILAPRKINHSVGLGLETPELTTKTIEAAQKHVQEVLDSFLIK